MNISKNGIYLIKQSEGFSAKWYICPAGFKTIGYGHKYVKGDELKISEPLSLSDAHDLLMNDLKERVDQLNNLKLNLSQNEFDATISFIFNFGIGAFISSTVYKMLKIGNKAEALVWWAKWINERKVVDGVSKLVPSPGLIARRNREIALFKAA